MFSYALAVENLTSQCKKCLSFISLLRFTNPPGGQNKQYPDSQCFHCVAPRRAVCPSRYISLIPVDLQSTTSRDRVNLDLSYRRDDTIIPSTHQANSHSIKLSTPPPPPQTFTILSPALSSSKCFHCLKCVPSKRRAPASSCPAPSSPSALPRPGSRSR